MRFMDSADWERWNGVTTETRDNFGRRVGTPDTARRLFCKQKQGQFTGASGRLALEAICRDFPEWVEE